MSILGYSASYYLPEYWASTPLYGEQIIALLDDALSLNYSRSDRLAEVYYSIVNKYKGTTELSVEALEEIISESGYGYIRDLFGNDVLVLSTLVYLLPMIHQYKGTRTGLELILNLLRKNTLDVVCLESGSPLIERGEVSNFSPSDYIYFKGLKLDDMSFEINCRVTIGDIGEDQCIFSSDKYGFALNLSKYGTLSLSLGNDKVSWNIADDISSVKSLSPNSLYFLKFLYDGFLYKVQVSTDGIEYSDYISVESSSSLGIHSGKLYIGVNGSSNVAVSSPFKGSINKDSVHVAVDNITITEWFEQFPVGDENTYRVETDVDMDIVSTDFFEKFWEFSSRYLYPSLSAFEANLPYDMALTVTHYAQQKMKYVCEGTYGMDTHFEVKTPDLDNEWEEFKTKFGDGSNVEFFNTVVPKDELN